MAEIRRDLFTDKIVIVATERSKRPSDFKNSKDKSDVMRYSENCSFCLGNEEVDPPEIERIEKDGRWRVRAVPNKFPILTSNEEAEFRNELHNCIKGQGFHEVIIETDRHNGNFFNMEDEEFINYLTILKRRYSKLKRKDKVKYISIFKNYLNGAGASLRHPHSQILTLPIISPDIAKEISNAKEYYDRTGLCLHEYVMDYERKENKRVIHETSDFIIIAPYASLYNSEVGIFYKHNNRFEYMSEGTIEELSILLKTLFQKMYKRLGNFPFNMYFHTHPLDLERTDFYKWHIHIAPRLSNIAGFELATGVYVNEVSPEDVSASLKW